jgi:ATP-dependent Clp protease ATP-binding subunit ClpA
MWLRGLCAADPQIENPQIKNKTSFDFAMAWLQAARDGKLDPVIGRDDEVRRCIQILSRRTKNNPVLIGEPGVGKVCLHLYGSAFSCCTKSNQFS